ncbi:MAG: dihydrofolate reductase family protein [Candidatus Cyclobacteriaceae bacterium M3_2C_046]
MRKLIVYISASLDGYIAQPNDDLSFLSMVQKEGEDYGYQAFINTVDTVIMGRRTYDWVIKKVDYPHADKESYIITRTERPPSGNIVFYTGSLTVLVNRLKSKAGKHIFCDGGSEIVNELVRENLVDEWIISIVPVLTGNGIRLFQDNRPYQQLNLLTTKSFDSGLVQLHYGKSN